MSDSENKSNDLSVFVKDFENEISLVASVAQLFFLVFTVIYAESRYDLWDLLIAGTVIYLWRKYQNFFLVNSTSQKFAKFGVAISGMLIFMFIDSYVFGLILGDSYNGAYLFLQSKEPNFAELATSALELWIACVIFLILNTRQKPEIIETESIE